MAVDAKAESKQAVRSELRRHAARMELMSDSDVVLGVLEGYHDSKSGNVVDLADLAKEYDLA